MMLGASCPKKEVSGDNVLRNVKQRNMAVKRLAAVSALVLLVPAFFYVASLNASLLGEAGESAAILSAALNMPDGSIDLLKERFREEIFGKPTETPQASEPAQPQPQEEQQHTHTPKPEQTTAPESTVEPIPEHSPLNPTKPPNIPAKYEAEIISENFAGRDGGTLIPFGAGYIKNETKQSAEKIEKLLEKNHELVFENIAEPQVLIFHTHATESFERYDSKTYDTRNTWRSTDNNNNMVAVGSAMEQVLLENGIGVIHDTTQHDYPSYNGSYERSAKTIQQYLDEYPTIKVVLDLHRDAMERDNAAIVRPVATIDGVKAAQIMTIVGCDDGTMDMPNWAKNLRFAAAYVDKMQQMYPDLCRPIYFCYRKYNMDMSDGSLLLEFGSNGNTLDEAVNSAKMAGQALADIILESENQ